MLARKGEVVLGLALVLVSTACGDGTGPDARTTVPTELVVTPMAVTLPQGSTVTLAVQVLDATGAPIPNSQISFTPSDPGLITASAQGVLAPVGLARSTAVRVASGPLSVIVPVTVTQTPKSIQVTPSLVVLRPGGQEQPLAVVVRDAVGELMVGAPMDFHSDDAAVAGVSTSGMVQSGGRGGVAAITVTSTPIAVTVRVAVGEHPLGSSVTNATVSGVAWGIAVSAANVVYATTLGGQVLRATLPAETFQPLAPTGGPLLSVAFDASGARAYVAGLTCDGAMAYAAEIDVATGTATHCMTTTNSGQPFVIGLSPNGQRLFVGTGDGSLIIFDASTRSFVRTIGVGGTPNHLAFSLDGSRLYASSYATGRISEIDLSTETLSRTIDVGGKPQGIALSADARTLYIADEDRSSVRFWNLDSNSESGSVATPSLFGLAITRDFEQLYATAPAQATVQVIDISSRSLLRSVPVGGWPRRITFDVNGLTALTANELGTVSFIR
jgi:DNA-binding beta-propeller fold protein YncE